MTELYKRIGRRIFELRESRGYTQETLAGRAGMSPKFFGQIERGEKNSSLKKLARIASALDVDLSEFFQPESADARYRQLSTGDFMAVRELHDKLGNLMKRRATKPRR